MCGIAGYWARPGDAESLTAILDRMTAPIVHRGPDAEGSWVDPALGLGLGHRRLSIIDLSPQGRQPMVSHDGRFVLSYNGEIYNFGPLRDELVRDGCEFRGGSDSEVLIEAIARWGLEAALPRLVGMFAFALFDRQEGALSLVRDRLGIKPMLYGRSGGDLLFASDLASLEAYPGFAGRLDRAALTLYARHLYVPAPQSIYQNVKKLPPGHRVTFRGASDDPVAECWWDAEEVAADACERPLQGSPEELIECTDAVLREAVRDRMVADVPLGAFLSGGIDSSTVVALMQAQSDRPVRTFSIGFRDDAQDEAAHARLVADHLGTDHTELYVTDEEAREALMVVPDLWTEPFADPSQLPTYLVSRLARGSVTVSLSGDGGDELYGGYGRYQSTVDAWRDIARLPAPARGLAALARKAPVLAAADAASGLLAKARIAGPDLDLRTSLAYRAQMGSATSLDDLYRFFVSAWKEPDRLIPGAPEPAGIGLRGARRDRFADPLERMMIVDTTSYLPGDILEKVDRASMGVSLEARVPLLDHRVFEHAWRTPLEHRVHRGVTKWPLREVLSRYVPRALFERPKQGFRPPLASWLRGPLRDWAEAQIDPCRLEGEGVFSAPVVQREWQKLQRGRGSAAPMWAVLMFQAWLERHRRHVSL